MNPFSCCSSCSGNNAKNIFSLGSYIPESPGYPQTYSMPSFKPMGMAGPLMGQNVARPYPGAPGPVFADQGNPNFPRSNGNPTPFYRLSKVKPAVNPLGRQVQTGFPDRFNPMGAYANTGNPNIWNPAGAGFQPMGAYANTGNPNIFNPAGAGFQPMGAYPSPSNPMGMSPYGENMPAHIGHPSRMGDGIGGAVQPLYDYVPESFHTMGASPQPSLTEVLCKNGTWDITSGFVAPCFNKGGEAVPRKVRPYAPPPPPILCPPNMKSGNCTYRLV